MSDRFQRKLYVGGLDPRCAREDLRELFNRFGRVEDVWVARSPPGFAFVTMEDKRDAEDSMNELNNSDFMGNRLRVEIAKPDRNPPRFRGEDDRFPPPMAPRYEERRGGYEERPMRSMGGPYDQRPPYGGYEADNGYVPRDRGHSSRTPEDRVYQRRDDRRKRASSPRKRSASPYGEPERQRDRSASPKVPVERQSRSPTQERRRSASSERD